MKELQNCQLNEIGKESDSRPTISITWPRTISSIIPVVSALGSPVSPETNIICCVVSVLAREKAAAGRETAYLLDLHPILEFVLIIAA